MLKGGCKSSANHISQDVKDHHVGVLQEVVLLQQFHGLPCHVATAARACRWPAAFHTLHTVEAGEDEIIRPELFTVKINLLQDVNHRWHHHVGEGEGAVVLWVAADLQHPLSQFGKSG